MDGAMACCEDGSVNYIRDLTEAVAARHNCRCEHVRTVTVHEAIEGHTVWYGHVEVFKLTGHPTAIEAFGWGYVDNAGQTKYAALLALPPVDSPETAVRSAIESGELNQ
jgi:hypothetical protein